MQILPRTAGKSRLFKLQYVILAFVGLSMLTGLYLYQAFGSGSLFNRNSGGLISGRDTTNNRDSALLTSTAPLVLDTAKYDQLLHALVLLLLYSFVAINLLFRLMLARLALLLG